jgi:hypothetical protein
LRGQPDLGEVADADQIGEHLGIGVVGLVGTLFHPLDVAGVRQIEVPAVAGDEFVGQIRRAGAGLDRAADMVAVQRDQQVNGVGVVGA